MFDTQGHQFKDLQSSAFTFRPPRQPIILQSASLGSEFNLMVAKVKVSISNEIVVKWRKQDNWKKSTLMNVARIST